MGLRGRSEIKDWIVPLFLCVSKDGTGVRFLHLKLTSIRPGSLNPLFSNRLYISDQTDIDLH
jgi:hypothetical protein